MISVPKHHNPSLDAPCLWINQGETEPDTQAAFRGTFQLAEKAELKLQLLGATWFQAWLDGEPLTEGPSRYDAAHPEYEELNLTLEAGQHVLAFQVHHDGVATRILSIIEPFLWCNLDGIDISWRCLKLDGYTSGAHRHSEQFGWIEWCNLAKNPADWTIPDFNDVSWPSPVEVERKLGEFIPVSHGKVLCVEHTATPIAEGPLASVHWNEIDDFTMNFYLRDHECVNLPADGLWQRFDLGRVRLVRPQVTIDAPKGTIVEIGYSETLTRGRVSPHIPLVKGKTCNLDHYECREGEQTLGPITHRGGRFIEIHVIGDYRNVQIKGVKFLERCAYGEPSGHFECEDPLLNRIWETGVETYRACSEDAVTDNPTRERGQWLGDFSTVGFQVSSAAFSDTQLARRGLRQLAWCANEDGVIAGHAPGLSDYLSSFSLQWVGSCISYHQMTGDQELLRELLPFAEKNLNYYRSMWTADGLSREIPWPFIDWGYHSNEGPSDMAVNLHFRAALVAMLQWCRIIGENAEQWEVMFEKVDALTRDYLESVRTPDGINLEKLELHRAVMALEQNLFKEHEIPAVLVHIEAHYLNCFPNNPEAVRLASPRQADPGLFDETLSNIAENAPPFITPYFSHYVFPLLIENGRMDFVLDQFRTGWGWMLSEGQTTWMEVFDTRWSHCHQWSGCPTWQLSRYALGLHTRFDLAPGTFELNLVPGSLKKAKGVLPVPQSDDCIAIEWRRSGTAITYLLKSDCDIMLLIDGKPERIEAGIPYKVLIQNNDEETVLIPADSLTEAV